MSRLAKKAQQEQSRRAQVRPYVIGIGSVMVLLAAIFITGLWQPDSTPPRVEITPGRIHVEGVDALVDVLPGEKAQSAQSEEVPETSVRFYELLGAEGVAGQPEELVMRDLPLPPPPGEEPVLFPLPETETPAPELAPKGGAEPGDGALSMRAGSVNGTASIPHTALEAPAETAPIPVEHVVEDAPVMAATGDETTVAAAQPIEEAEPPGEPEAPKPFTLQVASFSQSARAEELMSRLEKAGHETYLVPVDLGTKGLWWRVRVGHYENEHAAKWARLDLIKLGVSPIVVRDPDVPSPSE